MTKEHCRIVPRFAPAWFGWFRSTRASAARAGRRSSRSRRRSGARARHGAVGCAGANAMEARGPDRRAAGLTSEGRERITSLEREVGELRQANAILRKASAYFA